MNTSPMLKKRTEKITNIVDNLTNVPDDHLPEILKIVIKATKNKENRDEETRYDMIQFIEKNLRYCIDDDINRIEDTILKKDVESKDEKFTRIILDIINKSLRAIDKPKIHDICDFKMTRDDFLSDGVVKVFNDNKKYIFENEFDKKKCKAYQSKIVYKHVSIFRGMLKQANYIMISKTKFKTNNYVKTPYTMYYINKMQDDE